MIGSTNRFAIRSEGIRHFLLGRSLADCAQGSGRDIIHWLRLIAALLVVLGHCNLGGPGAWPYDFVQAVFPQMAAQVVGLMMFFVISGFLITLSFIRRPEPLRFLRARVLRLWPALFACIVAWAFVLGPILSDLPWRDYFTFGRPDSPYLYVLTDATLFRIQNALPGLFAHNPLPGQVNTPLWSIPVEATMYLWVGGAGVLRLLHFPWLTSIAIAALFSVLILWPMSHGQFAYMANLKLTVQGLFGAGAIACLLRNRIRISTGLMLVLASIGLLASHSTHAMPFAWLMVTYFVFWFAYVPRLPPMPYDMDLSYATYIWAWPVQQAIITVAGVHEPLILFATTASIVLPIASLSWFCIEKPALRLKDWRRPARRDIAVAPITGAVPS